MNRTSLLSTFQSLVAIDSPSGEEKNVAEYIKNRLIDVGCETTLDAYGNVIAHRSGEGEPCLFSCHMDTVEPGRGIVPIIDEEKGVVRSSGDTILGGDPKAGIAALITALKDTQDLSNRRNLEIIISCGEEIGMEGVKNVDYSKLKAAFGFVLDGEGSPTRITVAAPGYYQINARIKGRAAHAGCAPEKGISAIRIASEIISALPLGKIDEESSVNIGLIEGGSARNAVPEITTITGEIRSRDNKKLEKLKNDVERIFHVVMKNYPEATIELSFVKEFEGYVISSDSKALVLAEQTLRKMGLEPVREESGGGSDSNIICAQGIDVVDIGVGTYELHSCLEYVNIAELEQVCNFCISVMKNEK